MLRKARGFMVQGSEFTFPSCDGVHAVHAALWTPDRPPRAVVQVVHGVSEHMARYDGFSRFLAGQGFVVVGGDHLGHGKTASDPREFGYLGGKDGWKHVAGDLRALRELAGARYPGLPYFLLGHSMGSFLVRLYLIQWPGTVSGAILSGTGQEPPALVAFGRLLAGLEALRLGPQGQSALLVRLSLGSYNRRLLPARTRADWISRDAAVVDAYVADPFCSFYPTVSMYRSMMEGLAYIARGEQLGRMDPATPVYLFSGEEDPVGQYGAGVRKVWGFFRRAGCRDLTLRLYPGGRHEMLNETNRQQVYEDVLTWLEGRLTAGV